MKGREGEHIDELFRKGMELGNDPVDLREQDWTTLQQRLDHYARKKRAAVWLRPLSGVAAILLLALGIWALWPASPDPSTQQVASEQQTPQTPEDQNEGLPTPEKTETDPTDESSKSPALAAREPVDEQLAEKSSREELGASGERTTMPETDGRQAEDSNLKEIVPAENIAENQVATPIDSIKPPDPELAASERPRDGQSKQAVEQPEAVPNPPIKEPDYAVAKPEPRLIALSVLVAPAYNGVDNLNNGKTGTDVGLLVTLGLTKRWSFSTGALYAKKLYETGFSSNYSNGNNGYGDPDIQTVDADCRVLDIPLNINYAIIDKGKTTISLGTGISSYIMLKEDYRFNSVSDYGDNPADIHLVNENQHWLSVLNLHASYQQRLNSKMSLSLQPYLKIPVKDIGYARVRLQSLGMALSASWTL